MNTFPKSEVYITEYRGFSIYYNEDEKEFYTKWCEAMTTYQYSNTFEKVKKFIEGNITEKRFHRATQTLFNLIKEHLDKKEEREYSELEMYRNSRTITCIHYKLGDSKWYNTNVRDIIYDFYKATNLHISLGSFSIIDSNKLYMWWRLEEDDIRYMADVTNAHRGDELTGGLSGIYDKSTDNLWWDHYKGLDVK